MKILCVGGGSGGHITPVAAVTSEILKQAPDAEIHFITDGKFFDEAVKLFESENITVSKILAGKFRRYANMKWHYHFQHIFKSYIPNIIDAFKIIIGILQSWSRIVTFRPDVVFIKGGYVGLPVGIAAALLYPRPPIILHDSDASPGLTNRVLSRYATKIATGMPTKFYHYDSVRTVFVGIPIRAELKPVSKSERVKLKQVLGFDGERPLILAMGGGQGSLTINQAILDSYENIKGRTDVLLVTGSDKFDDVKSVMAAHHRKFIGLNIRPYLRNEMLVAEQAADIVVTRAGATTMAELALIDAATIVIPSPYLASDHQTKNARVFADANAAIVLSEKDVRANQKTLPDALNQLLDDKDLRKSLGENLRQFAQPDAARRMAEIIIEAVDHGEK
ncbi:MAG: UDP-N-acetylglucosamine--N-acetylmuramyl-(pentapeptide) pyrophosphoryl-undecaprenol N-acetylglucosamine transferase [Candidatus Nomurabacteria bacterium]|jgi:UDP-N-acetylglucosamine--N-acetylmuramyl-(pentapeptide) pyrophosphoryl-undecaprenol N-acetylglucosamine transferase|nr:UDP-N-acetylglucosamine--N-acetylmuramyl-(pentapeptide) pyrophosphoryl-undecaprenol N-acetylglucosamine transferase [Candidatus Nomurabacteria bacterium]